MAFNKLALILARSMMMGYRLAGSVRLYPVRNSHRRLQLLPIEQSIGGSSRI